MAQTSLRARLTRLFSTNVIVRHAGGRKLKIERDYVINYFNSIPTKKIIFVINYQKNKEYHESKRLQGGLTADEIKAQIMSETESLETGASVEGAVATENGSVETV